MIVYNNNEQNIFIYCLFPSNFQSREPNNLYGNEDCVDITTAGFYDGFVLGGWNDVRCDESRQHICELSGKRAN